MSFRKIAGALIVSSAFALGCGSAESLDGPAQRADGGLDAIADTTTDTPNQSETSDDDSATGCVDMGGSCAGGATCCDSVGSVVCNSPGSLCGMPEGQCPDWGTACQSKSDCCLPLNCGPGGYCWDGPEGCKKEGEDCSQPGDCCNQDGLQCVGGTCQPAASCVAENAACDPSSPPCCAPFECLTDGTCGIAPTCPSTGDPCANCVATDCCAQYLNCQSSPACQTAIACALSCANQACVQQCMQNNPSPQGGQLIVCLATNCAAACLGG